MRYLISQSLHSWWENWVLALIVIIGCPRHIIVNFTVLSREFQVKICFGLLNVINWYSETIWLSTINLIDILLASVTVKIFVEPSAHIFIFRIFDQIDFLDWLVFIPIDLYLVSKGLYVKVGHGFRLQKVLWADSYSIFLICIHF